MVNARRASLRYDNLVNLVETHFARHFARTRNDTRMRPTNRTTTVYGNRTLAAWRAMEIIANSE